MGRIMDKLMRRHYPMTVEEFRNLMEGCPDWWDEILGPLKWLKASHLEKALADLSEGHRDRLLAAKHLPREEWQFLDGLPRMDGKGTLTRGPGQVAAIEDSFGKLSSRLMEMRPELYEPNTDSIEAVGKCPECHARLSLKIKIKELR